MKPGIAFNTLAMGRLVARNGRYRPQHPAVVVSGGKPGSSDVRLTWREFDHYVNRWAHALIGCGVTRGERVATLLPNSLELLATYWSCAKIGAAVVPLSTLLTTPGLRSLLDDAQPRVVLASSSQLDMLDEVRASASGAWANTCIWVLVDDARDAEHARYRSFAALTGRAPHAAPDVEVEAADLFTLMYTSGTTGLPKGIQHTHFIRAMYATLFANAWRMAPESVVLHSGALVFNGAMATMFPIFMLGGTYVLHRQFDPEAFIATVESERVTHTMLVPAQIIAILNARGFDPARLASLEMVMSVGAPLHREHKERLNLVLPRRLYELYGLTEGLVTILDRDDAQRKVGSVGVPPPFYELRIEAPDGTQLPVGEVGEIVGRGPITMPGYYHRPEQTAEALRNDWLHSGDLGYIDEDGYVYLVDRVKDMIDTGGMKVYPRDVEEIVARHPAVREVAVFGIPDEKWGETPVAAVVLRESGAIDPEALREWINAHVAARYQRVARVLIMDDFPRNAAGKTLKRDMRAPFWAGREQKI